MNRRTIGLLAGVVSSAMGAWWWARQRAAQASGRRLRAAQNRGTVIFHNTPTAVEGEVI